MSAEFRMATGVISNLGGKIAELNSNLSTLMLMMSQLVSDCDTATDPNGNYYCNESTLNKPGGRWYFLRTINRSGKMVFQVASLMNTQNPDVYFRSSDNTGVFGSWKKVTLT